MYTRKQELVLIILFTTLLIFSYLQIGKINTPPVFRYSQNHFLIDINTADWQELDLLRGIGTVLAKRVVEHRNTYGGFHKPEDLLAVKGITKRTLNQIKNHITVSSP